MQISPVTAADLEQLAGLYKQLSATTTSLDQMQAALEKNDSAGNPVVLVAKIDDKVVGTLLAATCQMLFGECRSFMVVEDVVIDAAYRRRGIGKALMQHAEQLAQMRGCSYIMLITDTVRVDSQAFYHALGYKSVEYCAFKKHLNPEDRAARGSRQKYDRALNKVKNVPAEPSDRL